MVHAYDLNMQVPDTPAPPNDDESVEMGSNVPSNYRRGGRLSDNRENLFRRNKRQRTSDSLERGDGPSTRQRYLQSPRSPLSPTVRTVSPHTMSLKSAVEESDDLVKTIDSAVSGNVTARKQSGAQTPVIVQQEVLQEHSEAEESAPTPGLRHSKIRELLHLIINESLRVGGRPDSAVAEDTDGGEIIEVRSKDPDGETRTKVIEWSVDPRIPETIFGESNIGLRSRLRN